MDDKMKGSDTDAKDGSKDDIHVANNDEGSIVIGNPNLILNPNQGIIIQHDSFSVQKRLHCPKPPRKPKNFVGRENELRQIEAYIRDGVPVVISGQDGIGKSTLLRMAANGDVAKAMPDGVLWLDFSEDSGKPYQFEDAVQFLFDSLFDANPPIKVNPGTAHTYLTNTRPLVLINAPSLSRSDLVRLANLLPNSPILIATQWTGQLPDNYKNLSLGPLTEEQSLMLLGDPSAENREVYCQIARLVENVPAALVIMKKVIDDFVLTQNEILKRLQTYNSTEKNIVKAAHERAYAVLLSTLAEDERNLWMQAAADRGISVNPQWLEEQ